MEKLTRIATLLNGTSPDLTRFRARGGKILMYFGWADPALNPLMGVNYYEQVRQVKQPAGHAVDERPEAKPAADNFRPAEIVRCRRPASAHQQIERETVVE